ncbi:hypothetical protein [Paludisphaera mucosa]|uniref:TetR family transcriptional regulator n=1 Tax=Paludisphaera mucosa TaxID=3030827 RepID=A0ABT6FIL0_9BACT|nr:hypothetical protein [Paludisphaera mucosa]MDG3007417.1 hypothetical protein [Paludisphaera mucosa]
MTRDRVWDVKFRIALGIVRSAADSWSVRAADAQDVDSTLAVLFRIFSSPWRVSPVPRQLKAEVRVLADWRALVSTANSEARRLNPQVPAEVVERLVDDLAVGLRSFANEWSKGDPENPPTTHALNAIVHALFEGKLVRRPANPRLPTSLRPYEP